MSKYIPSKKELEDLIENPKYKIQDYCKEHNISRMKFQRYCKKYNLNSKTKKRDYDYSNSHICTGYKELSGTYWSAIKNSAKHRKINFEIDIQYAYDIIISQDFKCAISGLQIEITKSRKIGSASLDRIDSTKGYIKGNIQWVHKHINAMKGTLSQNQFIEYCKIITENNQ